MREMKRKYSAMVDEEYCEIPHPSGLKIYVIPKDMSCAYAVLATRYGSVDSSFVPAGQTQCITVPDGIAHFLEHKMFENEDGEDTFAKYARFGGNANAFTSFDQTAYLFSATDHIYENLEVLLDFVTHPYFTAENVKKEQGIIGEELRMYLDNPMQKVYYNLLEAMYENHPCKRNIGGTIESISHITPEILYQCYHTFYRPDNMILVISGNVEAERVAELADRYYPAPAEKGTIQRCYPAERQEVVKPLVTDQSSVSRPLLYVGVKDTEISKNPAQRSKKSAAVEILLEVMFGKCSDFYNRLYESGMISSLESEYEHNRVFSYVILSAECDQPKRVLEELRTYAAQLRRTHGITQQEFERAKRVLYADDVTAFDSTETIASVCLDYALDDYDLFSGIADVAQVTLSDVFAVLDQLFDPSHIAASIVYPIGTQEEEE